MTATTSKVLILRTLQRYLLRLKQPHLGPEWDSSTDDDQTQILLGITEDLQHAKASVWRKPIPQTQEIPEAVATGFYVIHPKCQSSGYVRADALFRWQTNLWVRGLEKKCDLFSFLLSIFHSYVMCVLQSSGQVRKQKAIASTHLMHSGHGAKTLCQVTLDLLDALA